MRRPYAKVIQHRRVMVNMVDGKTFEGVIWDERGPMITMRGVTVHSVEQGQPTATPMDGEVTFDRDRVAFCQVPG